MRDSDLPPGKEALRAYQMRIAEQKMKEHKEEVDDSIFEDNFFADHNTPEKSEARRQMLSEVEENFFTPDKASRTAVSLPTKAADRSGPSKRRISKKRSKLHKKAAKKGEEIGEGWDDAFTDSEKDSETGNESDSGEEDIFRDRLDEEYVLISVDDTDKVKSAVLSETKRMDLAMAEMTLPLHPAATTITWNHSAFTVGAEKKGKGKAKGEGKADGED